MVSLKLMCVPALSFYRGFGRRTDVRVNVCWWVWMVVRFVCVIRVPLCARVSHLPCVSRECVPANPVLLPVPPKFLETKPAHMSGQ